METNTQLASNMDGIRVDLPNGDFILIEENNNLPPSYEEYEKNQNESQNNKSQINKKLRTRAVIPFLFFSIDVTDFPPKFIWDL